MHNLIDQFEKLPPHNIEAETCTVGSMMLDKAMARRVIAVIDRADFYQAENQIVFDVICEIIKRDSALDTIILRDELMRRQLLDEIGGSAYLAQLISTVPSSAHGEYYAGIVRECALLRRLIEISNETLRRCYGPLDGNKASEVAQQIMTKLAALASSRSRTKITKLDEIMMEVHDWMSCSDEQTVSSGFASIDGVIGGFAYGEEVIIAGRPSMGKSQLAKCIAVRIASREIPVAFVSLEEGRLKIGRNLLSANTGIDNHRFRAPNFGPEEWQAVTVGISRLSKLPFYTVENARRVEDIAAQCSLMVSRYGVRAFVVDHLHRVHSRGKDKYEQATNASAALSDLWKELDAVGIVVAQLNRGVEHRDDKRPSMSDLRDSGAIEQDADGIMFLHREDYYHLDDGSYEPTGIAELIVAKWRDGVRGKIIKLVSMMKYQTFRDPLVGEIEVSLVPTF